MLDVGADKTRQSEIKREVWKGGITLARTIKGITVEIGGNTGPLDKALQGVNKTSRDLQSELKQVEKLLKLDPTNTELLAQKQKLLAESVDNTKTKLDNLKDAEKQVQQQVKEGKVSEEQYRALQREIISTEQKMNGLEDQGKKTNNVLSDDKPAVNLKAIGVAAGVAIAAVGVAFAGMAKVALDNADELQRQADVTGLTAERLQELQYAGNNLGVELETITGAQAKLTKSMAAAKDGTSAQADAFRTLGINVRAGNGYLRDAKDVMSEAFTALNGVGNETERDSLAMQIFGKSAMELNPLIKAGGDELNRLSEEARNNGAVMSDEAVAGLDAFGDTIDNLKTAFLGSFGETIADFLPNIQALINKLIELPKWIKENSTLLTIIGIAIATVTVLVIAYNIQQAIATATTGIWAVVAGTAAISTTALGAAFAFLVSPIGLVILAIGALIVAGVLLYKNWDAIKETYIIAWDAITSTVSKAVDGIKNAFDTIPSFIDKVISWFQRLPDAMLDIGKNIVSGIWNGITGMANWLWDKVKGFIKGIVDGIKGALGINSPSKVLADEVGKYMAQGIGIGFENEMGSVSINMAKTIPKTKQNYVNSSSNDANATSSGTGDTSLILNVNMSEVDEVYKLVNVTKKAKRLSRAGRVVMA